MSGSRGAHVRLCVHTPANRPWERCTYRRRLMLAIDPPSDSNPTSVVESAAAEYQHYEDDDEQSGRVHFLSRVCGERGPASSRPLNARDERWLFGALASGSRQLQRVG